MPRLFQPLIEARCGDVVGVGLTSVLPRRRRLRALWRHARFIGPVGLARDAALAVMARATDMLDRGRLRTGRRPPRYRSLATLARAHGIPVRRVPDANDPRFVAWLAAQKLDLVVCQVPDILRPPVLGTARLGCLNKHASLLPRHRGVHPVFWALLAGEREIGVTFHLMDERIDTGPVVLQRTLPVRPGQSMYGVYREVFEAAGPMLLEAVQRLEDGVPATRLAGARSTYEGHPGRADVRRFRAAGWRFGVPPVWS